ncbi:hypothetical protein CCACVL1_02235, partial [Corchorus capsularis]
EGELQVHKSQQEFGGKTSMNGQSYGFRRERLGLRQLNGDRSTQEKRRLEGEERRIVEGRG